MTRLKVSDLCFVPGAFKTSPIDTSRTQNVRWNNLRGWSGSGGFNRFPISGVGTHGAYCGPQSGISRQTWQGISFHLPAHSKVRLSVTSADLTCQAPKIMLNPNDRNGIPVPPDIDLSEENRRQASFGIVRVLNAGFGHDLTYLVSSVPSFYLIDHRISFNRSSTRLLFMAVDQQAM